MIFTNLISYFTNFFYPRRYKNKIFIEGMIVRSNIKPDIIDVDVIIEAISNTYDEMIKKYYNFLTKDNDKYDVINYNIITLISFETTEGYRAVEKNLSVSQVKDLNNFNKEDYLKSVKFRLIEVFEEYNIVNINNIIVKII